MTSLIEAIRNSQIDVMKTLIATGADLNESDKLSRAPIHLAGNEIEIVCSIKI